MEKRIEELEAKLNAISTMLLNLCKKEEIKIVNESGYPFEFNGENAGIDFHADKDYQLLEGKAVTINTGIRIACPCGVYGDVKGRSGLNFKSNVVVTQDGTIDRGYTGLIAVRLVSTCGDYIVHKGERIAQLVFTRCLDASNSTMILVDSLEATERGCNGFGSTGK